MRDQARRAETAFLGAMYRQMADEWELQAQHQTEGSDLAPPKAPSR
jgi:hypothetical protein